MNGEITIEDVFTPRQIRAAEIRYFLLLGLSPSQIISMVPGSYSSLISNLAKRAGHSACKRGRRLGISKELLPLHLAVSREVFSKHGSKVAFARKWNIKRQRLDQILCRHKENARIKVKIALLYGEIVRPEFCEKCNAPCIPDAHHSDYAVPLKVSWLCKKCHGEETAQTHTAVRIARP